MKQSIKLILVFTLLYLPVTLNTGCRHNTANLSNPKVATQVTLLDASNALHAIEDGVGTANTVVERLEATEPDYYAHVKPLLKKLSAAENVAQHKVDDAGKSGATGWQSAVAAVGASVTPADLTTFGFKNSTSQAIVESGFAALILALNQLNSKFGGK